MGIDVDTDMFGGIWSGYYWLGNSAVRFSAWLSVRNGRLTGSTLEPVFGCVGEHQPTEHQASLRGHLSEDEIVFLKTYDSFAHEPAYYEGVLSEDRSQIMGRWYFGWPDEATGAFELTLKSARVSSEEDILDQIRALR